MLFPIADMPKAPTRPYLTWGLMAINITVYLLVTLPATRTAVNLNDPVLLEYLKTLGLYGRVSAQEIYHHLSAYDLLVFQYGFRPAEFSVPTLFSSLFLHGGFMHLAGNMLFLYIFGGNVEYRLGHGRYLVAYLVSGVSASLFFSLFSLSSPVPLIGASGAIFGIIGCYFLWFPKNRVRCFVFLFPFLITTILLPARWLLGFYLVIDNLLPFLFTQGHGSGIAHGAHIGGFLTGLGIAWTGNRYRHRPVHNKIPPQGWAHTSSSTVEQACPGVDGGSMDQVAECFFRLKTREERCRIDTRELLHLGDYLIDHDRHNDALVLFRRLITERPRDALLDRVYFGAGRAMLGRPRLLTSAYHYFLAAIDVSVDAELIDRARRYLRAIEEGRIFSR